MDNEKAIFSKAERNALRQIRRKQPVRSGVSDDPLMAAPDIRRYAAEKGIDLTAVDGHGENGRITKEDIDRYLARMKYFEQMQLKYQQQKKTDAAINRAFRAENIFESDALMSDNTAVQISDDESDSESDGVLFQDTEPTEAAPEPDILAILKNAADRNETSETKNDQKTRENYSCPFSADSENVLPSETVRNEGKPKHYGFVTASFSGTKASEEKTDTRFNFEQTDAAAVFDYDVVVIGCGMSGFETALYASREGLKTAVVEKGEIGGKALKDDIIPRAYLRQNAAFIGMCGRFAQRGVAVNAMSLDLPAMMRNKTEKMHQIRENMAETLKNSDVDFYSGVAMVKDAHTVVVHSKEQGSIVLQGSNLIAATGTVSRIPEAYAQLSDIFTDGQAHDLERLPKEMIIIGSGASACEYAAFYGMLGTKIFLLSPEEHLLPNLDRDVQQFSENSLREMQVEIYCGIQIKDSYRDSDGNLHIEIENAQHYQSLVCTDCFVIRSQMPDLQAVSYLKPAPLTGEKGLLVDEKGQTSSPGLYAVGSVVGSDGKTAAPFEIIDAITEKFDRKKPIIKPFCINLFPQIAVVGLSESEAEKKAKPIKIMKLDAKAHMGFLLNDQSRGWIKLIVDPETDVLLGAAICCENAFEAAGMIQTVMTMKGTAADLAKLSCLPFSTVSFPRDAALLGN